MPSSAETWRELCAALERRQATNAGMLTSLLLEPFVLHAECADAALAQHILGVARDAGFRESGVSLGRKRVMVQIRTVAMRLEVPLAMDGQILVNATYFEALLQIANSRLSENAARVARLWSNLKQALAVRPSASSSSGEPWILVCPQACARSIKLALEARGWLDESRKMQSYSSSESAEVSPSIAIPLMEEAVDALQAISQDAAEAEEEEEARPSSAPAMASETETVEIATGTALECGVPPKKKRPPTVAANLHELWRQRRGDLHILQSAELPKKSKPTGGTHAALTERDKISEAIQGLMREVAADQSRQACFEQIRHLLRDVEHLPVLQWRGDVALLPRGSFAGTDWGTLEREAREVQGGLWECIRTAVHARLLCRQEEILVDDPVRGGNVQILAGSGSGWVVVPGPKSVRYAFDVTKCMFSEGNAAEKNRVASWKVEGETILDMYAGIGFWTLPLLAAGAAYVIACEWNPDALAGLREGLRLLGEPLSARCKVLPGDNRRPEVLEETSNRCHRVILGLIPYL